ncbi:MAG: helix-turn-helix domain-containing protein [Lachnospiraceae bacterium]|nr:helix-turn-helix domain-containing protein [Lachnospiraceae bacterium]
MEKDIRENPMAYSLDEAMEEFGHGRLDRIGLIGYLRANEAESLKYFRLIFITDVDGIYKAIEAQRGIWIDVQQDGRVHSVPYFDRLLSMLDDLQDIIENSYLMEELPPWWAYSIVVDTSGIALCMDYYHDEEFRPLLPMQSAEDLELPPDQSYTLIKVESKLLKVEDYAANFGVDTSAVRAWIRRGKLPAAIKYGREWRIPELCK